MEGIGTAPRSAVTGVSDSVLLVSGSLRRASTNTAALKTLERHAPRSVVCDIYDGMAMLPHFNPDDDNVPLHAAVEVLRDNIHRSTALLFSVPEYAGALPGSFKNLLDWTIGDSDPRSIYTKPVGWVNVSPRGADGAHEELGSVLRYAHARVVEAACIHIPVTAQMIGPDGLVTGDISHQLLAALKSLTAGSVTEGASGRLASAPAVD